MPSTPARQLNTFLRRFTPGVRTTAEAALRALRAQVPGATEMVYDKTNALVIGFAPRERPSEAVLSIALYSKWVNLYFLDGVILPDPNGILQGTGKRVRMLRLDDVSVLREAAVRALIAGAVKNADFPFNRARARRIVIRAVSTRARRA